MVIVVITSNCAAKQADQCSARLVHTFLFVKHCEVLYKLGAKSKVNR